MKNIYLLLFLTATFASVQAQITITEFHTPQINEDVDFHNFHEEVDVTNAGEDQVWDFSEIGLQNAHTINSFDPSESNEPESFPNSNLVQSNANQDIQYYMEVNEEALVEWGENDPGSTRIIYEDPKTVLVYPFAYLDTFSDTFYGTDENISDGESVDIEGSLEIIADGYGVLILPYGTVENVLRLKTTFNYVEEFDGNEVDAVSGTTYDWFNAYTGHPIASYTEINDGEGGIFVALGKVLEQTFVGVNEAHVTSATLLVYPNPADQKINTLNKSEKTVVSVMDMNGRKLKEFEAERGISTIDISDLSAGMYFIQYVKDNKKITDKLVVR